MNFKKIYIYTVYVTLMKTTRVNFAYDKSEYNYILQYNNIFLVITDVLWILNRVKLKIFASRAFTGILPMNVPREKL